MFNKLSAIALIATGMIAASCQPLPEAVSEDVSQVTSLLSPEQISSIRTWKVTANPALNCREDAGTENRVVVALNQGTTVESVLDESGRTQVKIDSKGRPWIRVSPPEDIHLGTCYVIAESRYIQPVETTHLRKALARQVSSWQVTAEPALNCREGAGSQYPVIFELRPGIILDSVKDSSEKTITRKDNNGHIWVKVNPRGDVDHNECYVFGDSRYLKPITHLLRESTQEGDATCHKNIRNSDLLASVETKAHSISICQAPTPNGLQFHYLAYGKGSRGSGSPDLHLSAPIQDALTPQGLVFKNGSYSYTVPLPEENSLSRLKVLKATGSGVEMIANYAIFDYYMSDEIILQ